jgi:hypothetical protein
MSVQTEVKQSHWNMRRDPDGLTTTIKEAWENLSGEPIQKIVECHGDDINVEERRGC